MHHARPLRLALLLLAPTACEDDGDPDITCAFGSVLSGDLSAELSAADGLVCLIQHSFDEGISVEYVPQDMPVERVSLDIDLITVGMTGDAFPATLRVYGSDASWGSSDCTASVSEHSFREPVELGDAYLVRGTGQCAGPLTDETGASSVALAPFEFVVVVTWAT